MARIERINWMTNLNFQKYTYQKHVIPLYNLGPAKISVKGHARLSLSRNSLAGVSASMAGDVSARPARLWIRHVVQWES